MRDEVFRRTCALFAFPDMKYEELEVPVLGNSGGVGGLFRRMLGTGGAADA